MINPLPFPPEEKPERLIGWVVFLLAAIITAVILFGVVGCAALTDRHAEGSRTVANGIGWVDTNIENDSAVKGEVHDLAGLAETNASEHEQDAEIKANLGDYKKGDAKKQSDKPPSSGFGFEIITLVLLLLERGVKGATGVSALGIPGLIQTGIGLVQNLHVEKVKARKNNGTDKNP